MIPEGVPLGEFNVATTSSDDEIFAKSYLLKFYHYL